jgi:predicted transcriptional regulator
MRRLSQSTEIPPPLELECLKVLWELEEANVKQVRDVLAGHRSLAYTTVMTVLERLVKRNCVARRKAGRSFVYAALLSQESVRQRAVKDLLDSFFGGSAESLRAYLAAPAQAPAKPVELHETNGGSRLEAALL